MSKQNERYPLFLSWPYDDSSLKDQVDAFVKRHPLVIKYGPSKENPLWHFVELSFPDKQTRKRAIAEAWGIEGVATYTTMTTMTPTTLDRYFPVTPEMTIEWMLTPPSNRIELPSIDEGVFEFRHFISASDERDDQGFPKYFELNVERTWENGRGTTMQHCAVVWRGPLAASEVAERISSRFAKIRERASYQLRYKSARGAWRRPYD